MLERSDKENLIKRSLHEMGIDLRGTFWDWAEVDMAIPEIVRIASGDPTPPWYLNPAKMACRTPEKAKAILAAIHGLLEGQVIFLNHKREIRAALGLA